MDTKQMRDVMASFCPTVDFTRDRELSLSSILTRGVWNGVPAVAVGGDRTAEEQISAVVDALHWCRSTHPGAVALRVLIGTGSRTKGVLSAVSTLLAARRAMALPVIEIFLDRGKPWPRVPRTFGDPRPTRWMNEIASRSSQSVPLLVTALTAAVSNVSFRWYRSVTGPFWSGRVEGLEVCSVPANGGRGTLGIGRRQGGGAGHPPAPVAFAGLLAGAPPTFALPNVPAVARAISKVAVARQSGTLANFQGEHFLESRVLRSAVHVPAGALPNAPFLDPVFPQFPFQFPTLWWDCGRPRFVDALMRVGSVPWVVELKDRRDSPGQYYRHAIHQVVLYREFVRHTAAVAQLFSGLGLVASRCDALVAFPGPIQPTALATLRALAADFDVGVVPVV